MIHKVVWQRMQASCGGISNDHSTANLTGESSSEIFFENCLRFAGSMAMSLWHELFWRARARVRVRAVVYWGGYTRVYAVYQHPGFFDSVYSPE